MTKAFDLEGVKKELTQADQLEAILYQFVNLYERWSEDRQTAAKQGADLSKLVKEFTSEVGQFAQLEKKVRDDIHTSVRNEAKNMAVYMGNTVSDAAIKEIEPTSRKFKDIVHNAENVLSRYQARAKFANWEMVIVSVGSSILLSLLIVFFCSPKPALPLTSQQIRALDTGEVFNEIWPKLTKAEKERFTKLANENGVIVRG